MSVLVRPIRFSNDVSAMATFLEAMGLTASVTSDQGGWATLQARTGGVSLHSAASSDTGGKPGQTSLCFDADDLEGLTGQLQEAGYSGPDGEPLVVNDQAYGRDLAVVVDGQRLTINGVMDDLYGYRSTGAEPGTGACWRRSASACAAKRRRSSPCSRCPGRAEPSACTTRTPMICRSCPAPSPCN